MLMVRFGKGVVMNAPLTIMKGHCSTNSQGNAGHNRRSSESFDSKSSGRLSDRVYAVPRVSLRNNSNSDSGLQEKISNLSKRTAILDKMLSLHFPQSMDSINIVALNKTFEETDLQILKENANFYKIAQSIPHCNAQEKANALNEIDNNLAGTQPVPAILSFINKNKSDFIAKL